MLEKPIDMLEESEKSVNIPTSNAEEKSIAQKNEVI